MAPKIAVAAGIVLACALAAGAQTIQKWQTPEGTLFFGDHPPEGSKLIGDMESLGSVSSPEMSAAFEADRKERQRKAALKRLRLSLAVPKWRHGRDCGGYVSIESTIAKQFGGSYQSVQGMIKNRSSKTLRNVKICAGGKCSTASWNLEPGETASYWLDTDHMIGQRYNLETECSIPEG